MEVDRRATAIAELVRWIGCLQAHFRMRGAAPAEPILRDFDGIEARGAVLAWSRRELTRATGAAQW